MQNWKVWPTPSVARFNLHVFIHELVGLRAEASRYVHGGGLMVQVEWRGNRQKAGVYLKGTRRNCTSRKPEIQAGGVASWNEGFDQVCKLRESSSGGGFRSWIVHIEIHGFDFRSSSAAMVLGKAQIDVAGFALERGKTLRIPIKCNVNGVFAATELTATAELFDLEPKKSTKPSLLRSLTLHLRFQNRKKGGIFSTNQASDADLSSEEELKHGDYSHNHLNFWQYSHGQETQQKPFLSRLLLSRRKFTSHSLSFGSRRCSTEETPVPDRGFGARPRNFSQDAGDARPRNSSEDSLILRQRSAGEGSSSSGGGGGGINNDDRTMRSSSLRVLLHQQEVFQAVVSGGGGFDVGDWESKSVTSRDGQMELVTDVFFASIDQCSEKADGGGACAVLVAVIADWLHKNKNTLPMRSHFDELIREGSSEWRKLCEDNDNRERFSDQHFDLETVLEAKVRPISVATTYVSFFSLDKMSDGLEHLKETMSFDSMWENIDCTDASEERIYITSWNDHFFVLKVERDAIYLIDTLGERLHEGCNHAYILKFSKQSTIYRLEKEEPVEEEEEEKEDSDAADGTAAERNAVDGCARRVLCEGTASCKEYIKGFLAALPLRELQSDIERGLSGEVHAHRRLQIEFHHTIPL